MRKLKQFCAMVILCLAVSPIHANATDVLDVKVIGSELARDIVDISLKSCVDQGYSVGVVVVDRNGDIVAARRSDYASRFTLEIAVGKARAVILSGVSSTEFRDNRADIRQELNHVTGVLLVGGALSLESAGSRIGAVGISGAPGADLDEACAQVAIDEVIDRLEF